MELTFLIYNNIKAKCQAFRFLIHVTIQIYLVITFKNTENTCLFILWIEALLGLMEEEGKKKGMTLLCLVRKENKNTSRKRKEKEGRMGGKKAFVESIIFFSLKITLIPSKGLVGFCE